MKRINNLEGILPLISSFKALRDIQGFDLNYDQKRLFNNAVLLQLKTHIDWKNLSATEAFELGNTVDCFYDRDIQYALRQLRSHICGQYRFDEAQIIHIGKHWGIPEFSTASFDFQSADLATITKICTTVDNLIFWESVIFFAKLPEKDLEELKNIAPKKFTKDIEEKIDALKKPKKVTE